MTVMIQSKVDADLKRNGRQREPDRSREDSFFSQVPQHLIRRLYDYHRKDYDMFGYPKPYYVVEEEEEELQER